MGRRISTSSHEQTGSDRRVRTMQGSETTEPDSIERLALQETSLVESDYQHVLFDVIDLVSSVLLYVYPDPFEEIRDV